MHGRFSWLDLSSWIGWTAANRSKQKSSFPAAFRGQDFGGRSKGDTLDVEGDRPAHPPCRFLSSAYLSYTYGPVPLRGRAYATWLTWISASA